MKKIISRISGATRTDFVRVSFWSAASTLVRMITGMVSTKVAAWTIGTSGMGIVGNFLNMVNIISMLGTGGIGQGVTKYVAQYYDDPVHQKQVIGHAVRVTMAATLLVTLLVLLFSRSLGFYIFGSDQYRSIIILFGVSIVLYSFNILMVYIINGFKAYRKFVTVNIVSSVLALAVSVTLVVRFGLYGALLSAIASQSVIILVTIAFVYRDEWFRSMFTRMQLEWPLIRKLLSFTLMTVISTFMVQFSQLNIRSYIGTHLSLHDAGLWESMNRISAMYLMVVTTSISTYYLPRLAELHEDSLIRAEIHRTMKIVLPPLFLVCLTIFLTKDIIIWVLFTKEFAPVRTLFAFQMVGDFFKMASWLIAFLFWAKAMTKAFIITEILFNALLVALVVVFVKQFGLVGSSYAYALNYFLYTILILILFRRILFKS